MRIRNLIVLAGLIGGVHIARADDAADAFTRGRSALEANHIHAACDAFAESEQLRAALDTELALAQCLEKDGQLVASAKIYRAAADKDADERRKAHSTEKAAKLEKRAPKLRFAIAPIPDGLIIKVDGKEVPTTGDVMVDLGPHEVIATAPGYQGHANAPVDREGQILDVILRMEATESAAAPEPMRAPEPLKPAPVAKPTPAPMQESAPAMASQPPMVDAQPSHRRRNAVIVGGVGIAALASAAVVFTLGTNKFDDEHALCPGHLCASADDTAKANSLRSDGRTYRQVGIGIGIGGAALVAAGAVLFATAHHHESPVALQIDRQGGSATYTVRF